MLPRQSKVFETFSPKINKYPREILDLICFLYQCSYNSKTVQEMFCLRLRI